LRQIAALQKAMLLLATLLLDAGVDITEVQQLLGHNHSNLRQAAPLNLGECESRCSDLT
jgi:hypothetical protein